MPIKTLGSLGKIRVGRVTGNTHIFFFGLRTKMIVSIPNTSNVDWDVKPKAPQNTCKLLDVKINCQHLNDQCREQEDKQKIVILPIIRLIYSRGVPFGHNQSEGLKPQTELKKLNNSVTNCYHVND